MNVPAPSSFYDLTAETLQGKPLDMGTLKGKVVLIVNTASKCGFTPQFKGLQELHAAYKDRGLVILGFPCNQFGNQEPGHGSDISAFCTRNYGVDFTMMQKCDVNGPNEHPVFTYLKKHTKHVLTDAVWWNFEKFLVDTEGRPVDRFTSVTKPKALVPKLEKLLPPAPAPQE